jgi:hypothetical protein
VHVGVERGALECTVVRSSDTRRGTTPDSVS